MLILVASDQLVLSFSIVKFQPVKPGFCTKLAFHPAFIFCLFILKRLDSCPPSNQLWEVSRSKSKHTKSYCNHRTKPLGTLKTTTAWCPLKLLLCNSPILSQRWGNKRQHWLFASQEIQLQSHTQREISRFQHGSFQLADCSFPPILLVLEEQTSHGLSPWALEAAPAWESASVQYERPSEGLWTGKAP